MTTTVDSAAERACTPGPAVRRRVTVRGVVQGVGFRPFVHTLATGLGLSGYVVNNSGGVVAEVQGDFRSVQDFCRRIGSEAPPLAVVSSVAYEELSPLGATGSATSHRPAAHPRGTERPATERPGQSGPERPGAAGSRGSGAAAGSDPSGSRSPAARSAFVIRPSEQGEGRTLLPPDTATCGDCLRELADPLDRRYRHPFITCTHCGPRLTIATGLPYDRAATTMAAFPMCPACAAEYADPADRRFHAQPVACPSCGPMLRLTPAPGAGSRPTAGEQALAEARRLLAHGAILAVKGIGGYHLACDAAAPAAVAALRRRKERGAKPFAVMCADLGAAARLARIGPAERAVLSNRRRPIVLLRRHTPYELPDLAAEVCPGSPDVGVMLPYAPLHQLLFGLPGDPPGPRVLVMTSGNRSGEPIVTDDGEALTRLAGLADAWLWHDRAIEVPCDDSVVRVRADGSEVVLRRSRGYAPAPVRLPVPVRQSLAVGGDLKNTLCLGADRSAWFSPHIGDMGDLATVRAFEQGERRLRSLTGVAPELLAADRHPGYHSARWAARHAAGRPVRLVQHHHAHIASVMAENGLDGGTPVIGVAFDGTGYGDDAAIWGGEVLLADYDGYRRLVHLGYVPLPGGDAGVGNPCRMALSQLRAAGLPWDADLPCVAACSPEELRVLDRQLDRGLACVPTSSMGRLFDAVSSLAGVCHRAGYEAQAAIELEAAAGLAWHDGEDAYAFALRRAAPPPGGHVPAGGCRAPVGCDGGPVRGGAPATLLDPGPVLRAIVADLRRGTAPPVIAARFHRAVAAAVVEVCRLARRETGVRTVALTGGVFANALLDDACAGRLGRGGFTVLRHGEVPPGDGGLALGQLMVAARAAEGRQP